ncbi:MAG: winged helix-turn-helix domain-containing protein [archaeon]
MAKRERLEVICDILRVIRDSNNRIKPTRLLYASNLSPQMFKEYIEELTAKGFVGQSESQGRKTFSLSDKGFEFLKKYREMMEFIRDFGL